METTLIKQAQKIATHYFGISGEVKILPGELDLNFYVVSNDNKKFILKIANEKEVLTNLQLQNAVIKHLSSASPV